MKKLILFWGMLLILHQSLISQNQYLQYITLQSNQIQKSDTIQEWKFENDTLILKYDFYAQNGAVRFSIFNKLNIPLYVDWKKCALIVGEQKFDYWENESTLQANYSGSNYQWFRNYTTTSGTLTGTIKREERIVFIPPQTRIAQDKFRVKPGDPIEFQSKNRKTVEVPLFWRPKSKKKSLIVIYSFKPENTPYSFRNFLTLSTDDKFTKEFYFDTKFWVSEIQVLDPRLVVNNVYFRQYLRDDMAKQHKKYAPNAFFIRYLY